MTDKPPALPGDLFQQVCRRAFTTLDRLRIGPNHAHAVGARWRLHPDAAKELSRQAAESHLVTESLAVPDRQYTLIGLPIIQDPSLDLTELRFEVTT